MRKCVTCDIFCTFGDSVKLTTSISNTVIRTFISMKISIRTFHPQIPWRAWVQPRPGWRRSRRGRVRSRGSSSRPRSHRTEIWRVLGQLSRKKNILNNNTVNLKNNQSMHCIHLNMNAYLDINDTLRPWNLRFVTCNLAWWYKIQSIVSKVIGEN